MAVSTPALMALMLATYYCASAVCSSRTSALAAILTASYPLIFGTSRSFLMDLPVAAASILSIAFLLRSDSLRNWKFVAGFVVSAAFGLWIKESFILYSGVPFILYLAEACLSDSEHRPAIFVRAAAALAIVCLLASPAYLSLFTQFGLFFEAATIGGKIGFPTVFSWDGLTLYFRQMSETMSPVLFVVFSVSFFICAFRRRVGFMLLWFVLTYVVLSLLQVKISRYLMPVFPVAAIITVEGLALFKQSFPFAGRVALLSTFVFCLVQFVVVSFATGPIIGADAFIPKERLGIWQFTKQCSAI